MLTDKSYIALSFLNELIQKQSGHLVSLSKEFESYLPQVTMIADSKANKKISLSSLSNEKYIDDKLKKQIIKLSECRTVVFQTDKIKFTLEFYSSGESLDKLIPVLMYSLAFTSLIGPHSVENIHIKYYLLDVKRVLDGDNYFDKEEVNGGACWTSPVDCDITVWRKEEIVKVSIHELIHGLSYDYKQDTQDIIDHYQSKYGITSPKMNTFEGYTELWAEIIHCFILAKTSNMINSKVSLYDYFSFFIGAEIQFSLIQASKILQLTRKQKDVNKYTNVTAYYLIKTELWLDLNNFLQHCMRFNKDRIKLTDKSRFLDYLKGLPKLKEKSYKLSGYLKQTTRMTCLEMNLF